MKRWRRLWCCCARKTFFGTGGWENEDLRADEGAKYEKPAALKIWIKNFLIVPTEYSLHPKKRY